MQKRTGKSAAFARIKQEVLRLAAQVPPGSVGLFADAAAAIDVMPRHVAYILATLQPGEEERVPWYRMVSNDGRLLNPAKNPDRLAWQAALLREEGVEIDASGSRVADVNRHRHRF